MDLGSRWSRFAVIYGCPAILEPDILDPGWTYSLVIYCFQFPGSTYSLVIQSWFTEHWIRLITSSILDPGSTNVIQWWFASSWIYLFTKDLLWFMGFPTYSIVILWCKTGLYERYTGSRIYAYVVYYSHLLDPGPSYWLHLHIRIDCFSDLHIY